MSLKMFQSDPDRLNRLAGITGLGWTASVLGYLSVVIGFGHSVIHRLVVEPQALLYLGATLFLATVGLDRLRDRNDDEDN